MDFSRIVLRVPNWLGDVVLALPAMAAVRARHPGAALTVVGPATILPIFDEGTALAPNHAVPADDPADERAALAGGGYQLALLFPNSFRSAWIARRAAVTERWGYRTDFRRWLLTRAVPKPKGRIHQADYYRRLVGALGYDVDAGPPRIDVRPSTRARAADVLGQYGRSPEDVLVGVAPGAAYGHAKRWPPSRVAEVLARLAGDRGATCVLLGAAGDRDAGREIESGLAASPAARDRVINLIGRTDLRLLMGLMSCCHAFLSNDSGAMHLAAAIGLHVTSLFGPTDERVTAPIGDHDVLVRDVFCRPCLLRDCPIDHRCMARIPASEVFDAVARRLDRAGAERRPS